ncbi:hypothetical protein DUHN55_16760 [Helicobacter pylori]
MTQDITTTGPSRRSIAKGAAWAVPAVSVAAAAPSLAASETCEPQTCAQPILSAFVVSATRNRANTTHSVTFGGAISASLISCTGLLSIGLGTLSRVEVTWQSNEATDASGTGGWVAAPVTTTTTGVNTNISLGVAAAGVFVIPTAGIAIPVPNIQRGTYLGVLGAGTIPSQPTSICFTIDYQRILGGGLPPQNCQARICLDPTSAVAAGSITALGQLATFALLDLGGA